MTIMECIGEYIGKMEMRVPIFSNDIYGYVAKRIPAVQKGVVNAYIVRYEKANPDFVRYHKGVYYRTIITPFGKAGIRYTELIKRTYMEDGDNVIGYETGPSYMNKLGLTTQMPACTYLATEKERTVFSREDTNLLLWRPVTQVNRENYRYLQFLDILDNRQKVKIESENYREILRKYIEDYALSFEKLLWYARYYKNNQVYQGLAELARG